MKFLKLTKPVKTKVVSYEKGADGKVVETAEGAKKVKEERTIEISGLEVPQYESITEASQAAGGDEKLLSAINKWTKDEAVAPVRTVGGKFSTDNTDAEVIEEGLKLAKNINPFEDRRGGGNAENKALANQMRSIQELASKGASDEELLALIRGGSV